jgi:hypothetical protein
MFLRFAPSCLAIASALFAGAALAKLPPPSDEAKAKAAEGAAKAAHAGKVDAYKLCKSMDSVATRYLTQAKAGGKTITPTATPACTDPGVFAAAPAAEPAATAQAPTAQPPKK